MAKILLLVAVVVVVLWLLSARRRPRRDAPPKPGTKSDTATPMLACAHCGVHLPRGDALADADGRAYCTEAHRLAGPR